MTKRKEPRKPAKDGQPPKVMPINTRRARPSESQPSASDPAVKVVRSRFGRGAKGGTSKLPRKRKRPNAWVQAEKLSAKKAIAIAREMIGSLSVEAVETLHKAMRGKIKGSDASTRQRAADSLLRKGGLGDTMKIETGPPVIVNLGGMPTYPKPDADVDGLEPEDPDAHGDPPGA